jgi:3-dehydroquinate dehydratase
MRSDTIIKHEGYEAIFKTLGIVETERFIAIIRREKFDYTEWRKDLFQNISVEELSKKAMDNWNKKFGK